MSFLDLGSDVLSKIYEYYIANWCRDNYAFLQRIHSSRYKFPMKELTDEYSRLKDSRMGNWFFNRSLRYYEGIIKFKPATAIINNKSQIWAFNRSLRYYADHPKVPRRINSSTKIRKERKPKRFIQEAIEER